MESIAENRRSASSEGSVSSGIMVGEVVLEAVRARLKGRTMMFGSVVARLREGRLRDGRLSDGRLRDGRFRDGRAEALRSEDWLSGLLMLVVLEMELRRTELSLLLLLVPEEVPVSGVRVT